MKKLIDKYNQISILNSNGMYNGDDYAAGVVATADEIVDDLENLQKMKLFKCEFEVDTGVNYNKKTHYVLAEKEEDCYNILSNSKKICPCREDSVINLKVEEVSPEIGLIM